MSSSVSRKSVSDRVVMITGANGGIGKELVARFSANDWRVLAADLAQTGTFEESSVVRYVSADVREHDQMARAVEAAQELGTLLGCIANAGITPEPFPDFVDAPREHWKTTLDVNVIGTLNTLQVAAGALVRGGLGGRLAATASVAGIRSEPQLPAYSASKAGVIAIVRSLATELGSSGIAVNAVAPGPVSGEAQDRVIAERERQAASGAEETRAERFERHRNEGRAFDRLAAPADVANAYEWLFSDAAAFITGQVLVVDGGGVLA